MAKKASGAEPNEMAAAGPAKGQMPPAKGRPKREVTMSTDFVSLYANDTEVKITPWDFRFVFGEITDIERGEPQPVLRIKTTGEVRMSPQHAKKVAEVLLQQIKVYESKIAEIKMPSS